MVNENEKLFVLSPMSFKTDKSKSDDFPKSDKVTECGNEYNSQTFCRTCANSDPRLVPIFQAEGIKYNLSKKIEKYLPIKVSEEDELPLQLCYRCASTLIAWETLVQGCVEAEEKLLALKSSLRLFKNQNEIKVNELTISNDEKKDDILLNKNDIDYVNKVDKEKDKISTLQVFSSLSAEAKRERVKQSLVGCVSSSDEFPDNLEDFNEKMDEIQTMPNSVDSFKRIIFEKNKEESNLTLNKSRRFFKCDFCKKVFNRKFNFERHLTIHTGAVITCNACGKQYKRQSLLDKHIKVVHEQIKIATLCCTYCNKVFSSPQSLEDHFRTHTGERPYMCEICGKDFRARPNLIAHKKIHSDNLPFRCNICSYRCRLKSSFVDHCQRHEGTRTCLCSVCGKGFVNNYDLTKHKKTHSKERKHSCGFCNLSFVMKRYLKVHMKTHGLKQEASKNKQNSTCTGVEIGINQSDVENHAEKGISDVAEDFDDDLKVVPEAWLSVISCKQCGKICCASKHLRQHEKRGTCFKSFQCTVCSQSFTKELNYLKHLKKHETEKFSPDTKRFSCGICNKKFKFEDNGLAHEKVCGKNKLVFKCAVCGKRFETKILADQHWTSHHKSCVCHMCGQYFGKPESLKQHMKTIHDDFKLVCQYCGNKFTRKARLQEHLQHHTGRMEFTCHVCGKGSTNSYSFGVHLATHSEETPYTCSFCPRTFKHMKYVYLHERSVHLKLKSGKTYVKPKKPGKNMAQRTCPCCSKTFKRESAMLIHKRSVHEGKNGYICKLCGKDFKYTYLLYVHKKKHHFPELCKYVCEYCDKPFPVKTELQNHLRKHTGEKPYVCGLCGKSYSFHGSLNMHMKTQHENKKSFKCTICDSSYNFQSHLSRHMNVHSKISFQTSSFLKGDHSIVHNS